MRTFLLNLVLAVGLAQGSSGSCTQSAEPNFQNNVSSNMTLAQALIDSAEISITAYCSSQTLNCSIANELLTNLTKVDEYFNNVIDDYTEYLNETLIPFSCPTDGAFCSCSVLGNFWQPFESLFQEYDGLWQQFLSPNQTDCKGLARELRNRVDRLRCTNDLLIAYFSPCRLASNCTCALSVFNSDVSTHMQEAITAVGDAVRGLPSPCQSNNAFCTSTSLSSVIKNSADLFASVYQSYTGIIGDSNSTISCPPSAQTCDCQTIQGQLNNLNNSYYSDYLPLWTNYTSVGFNFTNCNATAIELRALVGSYYCITANIYESTNSCQSACPRPPSKWLKALKRILEIISIKVPCENPCSRPSSCLDSC